ncbi:arsenosugar biosynthesis radical SAM (seleno)protein ArsS [Candidatus Margulisiibacteriota bacterium]
MMFKAKSKKIDIFQINIGKKCNLCCNHCHVDAGPTRTEMMSKDNLAICTELIKKYRFHTVDITGGSPELHPDLGWFLEEISGYSEKIIIRTNATLLVEKKYQTLLDKLIKHKVEIIASMPCYLPENVDAQRGNGTYQKVVDGLKYLNSKGYGKEGTGLLLNLVYNSGGAFLPGGQQDLEQAYKKELSSRFGIFFSNLFCITNMPIKRFRDLLIKNNKLDEYMKLLIEAYNEKAAEHVMCKNTLSVSWDGKLYDCDFNQALDIPVKNVSNSLDNFNLADLENREIVIKEHCYGCTAGAGSSCQGAID